jgi:hypothetical protein
MGTKKTPAKYDELLTAAEIAERIGVSECSVLRWCRLGCPHTMVREMFARQRRGQDEMVRCRRIRLTMQDVGDWRARRLIESSPIAHKHPRLAATILKKLGAEA